METLSGFKRSLYCGEPRISDVGRELSVCGWVQRARNLGGLIFIDLRDRSGIVQLAFDDKTDHRLLYRRLGVCAEGVHEDDGYYQMNFFIDYEALEREKRLQAALSEVRSKFGSNSLFTGKNMLKGATQLERNKQIGGHLA